DIQIADNDLVLALRHHRHTGDDIASAEDVCVRQRSDAPTLPVPAVVDVGSARWCPHFEAGSPVARPYLADELVIVGIDVNNSQLSFRACAKARRRGVCEFSCQLSRAVPADAIICTDSWPLVLAQRIRHHTPRRILPLDRGKGGHAAALPISASDSFSLHC